MKSIINNPGCLAQEEIERLKHEHIHATELTKLLPDLQIATDEKDIYYYSKLINSEELEVKIGEEKADVYVRIHACFPFRKIQISCSLCSGLLCVNTIPCKIPIFVDNNDGGYPQKEFTYYGLLYEEMLKLNDFHPSVLSKIQMYIFSKIEEKKQNKSQILNIDYIGNNIKKLLPFT